MDRKIYCDYLRGIATFAVVVLHVSALNWYCTDVNGLEWRTFNFFDSVVRWCVPIFVMISGSLFLDREVPLKILYSKYILRLMIAFFSWSIFYAAMRGGVFENGLVYVIKTSFVDIVSGYYHEWYILMIIGIYMCIPFYKKIISDNFIMKYFLALSFIFTNMIPWIIQLLKDYIVGNNNQLIKLVDAFNSDISTMSMHMVLGHSFYFVLGYYLDSVYLKKRWRLIIYILGLVGFVFTILADLDLALKTQQPCSNYYGYFQVNVILETMCIHTLFKYHEYKSERLNSLIYMISRYTFGVYLIHPFFIERFSSVLNFDSLSFNPVVSVPVVSGTVFICALLVSIFLKHIPMIKNIV